MTLGGRFFTRPTHRHDAAAGVASGAGPHAMTHQSRPPRSAAPRRRCRSCGAGPRPWPRPLAVPGGGGPGRAVHRHRPGRGPPPAGAAPTCPGPARRLTGGRCRPRGAHPAQLPAAAVRARPGRVAARPDCRAPGNPERGFFAFRDLLAPDLDWAGCGTAGSASSTARRCWPLPGPSPRPRPAGPPARRPSRAIRQAGLKVLPRFYYAADDKAPDARPPARWSTSPPWRPCCAKTPTSSPPCTPASWAPGANGTPRSGPSAADRRRILEALLAALPPARMVLVRRPHFKQLAFGGPVPRGPGALGHAAGAAGAPQRLLPGQRRRLRAPSARPPRTATPPPIRPSSPSAARPAPPIPRAASARRRWPRWRAITGASSTGTISPRSWPAGSREAAGTPSPAGWATASSCAPSPLPAAARAGEPPGRGPGADKRWLRPAHQPAAAAAGAGPLRRRAAGFRAGAGAHRHRRAHLRRGGRFDIDVDVCLSATLPADLPAGDYRVGLALPDPEPTLAGDPRYAVRLGGEVSFDAATAINWLDATVLVTP